MPAMKAASEGKDEVSADAVSSDAKASSIDCELATRKVARRVARQANELPLELIKPGETET